MIDLGKEHQDRLLTLLEGARDVLRTTVSIEPGGQATRRLSDAVDSLLAMHCEALAEADPMTADIATRYAVVAAGGYGRRELCLHSDVDLIFLCREEPKPDDEEFIRSFLYPLWNLKLELGYSVKTAKQLLGEIAADIDLATTIVGSRAIWGNIAIHEEMMRDFRLRVMLRHKDGIAGKLLEGVVERHRRHSNTWLLLEPNLKEAPGGLRDINVMMWLACILHGEMSLGGLVRQGILSASEEKQLLTAHSFLLRLRNGLHLIEGRKNDLLSFERQIKVAPMMELDGGQGHLLPEEQLMRHYYHYAGVVERLTRRTCRKLAETLDDPGSPGVAVSPGRKSLRRRRLEGLYWTRDGMLWIEPKDASRLPREPGWIMHMFSVAALHGLEPDEYTLDLVEMRLSDVDEAFRRSPIQRDRFLGILRHPRIAARTLRLMHRCGFLETYIPEFALVRNLPRIDYYHQFTVDEHLLRSVECLADLFDPTNAFSRTHVATMAQQLLRLDLICFALLFHDIGKGEGRGHVIRGAHIVRRVAERMGLSRIETEVLHQLVLNHQKLSTLALKRNPEDPAVPRELARDVGEPDMLRKLYVLTCCDLRAVSDESWNDWRGYLLATLYGKTARHLLGKEDRTPSGPQAAEELVREVVEAMWEAEPQPPDQAESEAIVAQISALLADLPDRYRHSTPSPVIARHMRLARQLDADNVVAWELEPLEDANYSFLHSVVRDAPGLFCHLCGALASRGYNILSAQIYTARNGMCIDLFQIQDMDNQPPQDEESLVRLRHKLNDALRGVRKVDWASQMPRKAQPVSTARLDLRPPSVTISNEDSGEGYTLIEVKAPDRPGLLFEITRVLDRHRIHIHVALVATESYQVVDVFYVTDWEHNRLVPGKATQKLHADLLAAVTPAHTIESSGTHDVRGVEQDSAS